jgi:hypothetical protein
MSHFALSLKHLMYNCYCIITVSSCVCVYVGSGTETEF